jgi:hypothetical protein
MKLDSVIRVTGSTATPFHHVSPDRTLLSIALHAPDSAKAATEPAYDTYECHQVLDESSTLLNLFMTCVKTPCDR